MRDPKIQQLLELVECGNDLVYVLENAKLMMPDRDTVDNILDAIDAFKTKRKALAAECWG